eukprot:jgi/Chrzof1/3936/Cz13g14040.t1
MLLLQVTLPNGEPVRLHIGVCSGASAAGIIGREGISFVVVGEAAHIAKHLADKADYLMVSESTWRRLNKET